MTDLSNTPYRDIDWATATVEDFPNRNRHGLWAVVAAYAKAGYAVFPVVSKKKIPAFSNEWLGVGPGKGGFHAATTDLVRLACLFSRPGADGIGLPTGAINGLIVWDGDIYKPDRAGFNARAVLELNADAIQSTYRVRTQRGGLHCYFAYEPGHSKQELGDGVEVQTDGAFVLIPPSLGYTVDAAVPRSEWPQPHFLIEGADGNSVKIGGWGGTGRVKGPGGNGTAVIPDHALAEALCRAVTQVVTGASITPASQEIARLGAFRLHLSEQALQVLLEAILTAGLHLAPGEATRYANGLAQVKSMALNYTANRAAAQAAEHKEAIARVQAEGDRLQQEWQGKQAKAGKDPVARAVAAYSALPPAAKTVFKQWIEQHGK